MNWSREVGAIIFSIVVPGVVFGIQITLYLKALSRLRRAQPARPWFRYLLALPFVAFNLALVILIILRFSAQTFPRWLLDIGLYPFFIWHGSTFFIGLVLGLWKLLTLPVRLLTRAGRLIPGVRTRMASLEERQGYRQFDASRRTFLRRSAYGLAAASFGGVAYGMTVGRSGYEITEAEFSGHRTPKRV